MSSNNFHNNYIYFKGITYYGLDAISSAHNYRQVQTCIKKLTDEKKKIVIVTLAVPTSCTGNIIVFLENSNNQLLDFPLKKAVFPQYSVSHKSPSFSLVKSSCDRSGNVSYQCHVFTAVSIDECHLISRRLSLLFYASLDCIPIQPGEQEDIQEVILKLRLSLSILEADNNGVYSPVPKEKEKVFKLRQSVNKKIIISVEQLTLIDAIKITKCLGISIGNCRSVSCQDLTLLDIHSVTPQVCSEKIIYEASSLWDPLRPDLAALNQISSGDALLTVGLQLRFDRITFPVSVRLDCQAKIFAENERFWLPSTNKRTVNDDAFLYLVEELDGNAQTGYFKVRQVRYASENTSSRNSSYNSSDTTPNPSDSSNQTFDFINDDEALVSGSGVLSMEVINETKLVKEWTTELCKLQEARHSSGQLYEEALKSKTVVQLARRGIPMALRPQLWLILSGCSMTEEAKLSDLYREYIDQDSEHDTAIHKDLDRTFPRHERFKDKDGEGQASLFRVCHAYSLHDPELGYIQGLSYLVASLIINIPEEEAFCLLVQFMQRFGLRDLYLNGFHGLYFLLHQIESMMKSMRSLTDLEDHFKHIGLHHHMYASQWLLTIFTSKFPLNAAFRILDVFLAEGSGILLKVNLAILLQTKRELMTLNFEETMRYFRITCPKQYKTDDASRKLILAATKIKITDSMIEKMRSDWMPDPANEDTVDSGTCVLHDSQEELPYIREETFWLEHENSQLTEKIEIDKSNMQTVIQEDSSQDPPPPWVNKIEVVKTELLNARQMLFQTDEDKLDFDIHLSQLMDYFSMELNKQENIVDIKNRIIAAYQQVIPQPPNVHLNGSGSRPVSESSDSQRPQNQQDAQPIKEDLSNENVQLLKSKIQKLQDELKTHKSRLENSEKLNNSIKNIPNNSEESGFLKTKFPWDSNNKSNTSPTAQSQNNSFSERATSWLPRKNSKFWKPK